MDKLPLLHDASQTLDFQGGKQLGNSSPATLVPGGVTSLGQSLQNTALAQAYTVTSE